MKALVIYYSETGNTEKLAKGLYDGMKVSEKAIQALDTVHSLDGYDIIFCGFPVIEHSVPVKMQKFLKTIPAGSKVALFSTYGAYKDSPKANTAFEAAATLLRSSTVLGTFGARGKVKDEVLEKLAKRPEHQSWTEEAVDSDFHPNESDLKDAADFANNMLEKIRT